MSNYGKRYSKEFKEEAGRIAAVAGRVPVLGCALDEEVGHVQCLQFIERQYIELRRILYEQDTGLIQDVAIV